MERKLMTKADDGTSLREEMEESAPSFASRWRGKFRESRRDDARYKALARKYVDGGERLEPLPAPSDLRL